MTLEKLVEILMNTKTCAEEIRGLRENHGTFCHCSFCESVRFAIRDGVADGVLRVFNYDDEPCDMDEKEAWVALRADWIQENHGLVWCERWNEYVKPSDLPSEN